MTSDVSPAGVPAAPGMPAIASAVPGSPHLLYELPLFPLQAVLFPQGHLHLKVFEARYVDLMNRCLRDQQPFGVVCLRQGPEARKDSETIELEEVGTLAWLQALDSTEPGVLKVHCTGGQRFRYRKLQQADTGLWSAHKVTLIPDDVVMKPQERFKDAMIALARAVAALDIRSPGQFPAENRRFTELGWAANRWAELLPLPLSARQQLMALQDPAGRLEVINAFLRQKKLI